MSNSVQNPTLPAIPEPIANLDSLTYVVKALKQALDVLAGRSGKLGRALTYADLVGLGLATPLSVSSGGPAVLPTPPSSGAGIKLEGGTSSQKISAMTALPLPRTSPVYVPAIQIGNTTTNYKGSISDLLTGVSQGDTLNGQGINITGGPGGATSGFGGNVIVRGGQGIGAGYGGGAAYMLGGGAINGSGGSMGLYAGNAGATGAGNYQGGGAIFAGGNGVNGGVGGGVYLQCGNGGITGAGGNILFRTGAGGATSGSGGTISLASGNAPGGVAGPILLTVGAGGPTADGNGIVLTAGAGGTSSGVGGDISMSPGTGTTVGNLLVHNLSTIDPGVTDAVWAAPTSKVLMFSGGTPPTPYTLPAATTLALGGIIAGANTTINAGGTLSVTAPYTLPVATTTVLGGVKQGTNTTIDGAGVISVAAPGNGKIYAPLVNGDALAGIIVDASGQTIMVPIT